jgi:isoleucyl-tRNA synthetase
VCLVLKTLLALLAPVLPYTTEEVFQCVREPAGLSAPSVLLLTLADAPLPAVAQEAQLLAAHGQVLLARRALNLAVCAMRESGNASVKGAAQLRATVQGAPASVHAQMLTLLGCAEVDVAPEAGEPFRFDPTRLLACGCCRRHEPSVPGAGGLCVRCKAVQS